MFSCSFQYQQITSIIGSNKSAIFVCEHLVVVLFSRYTIIIGIGSVWQSLSFAEDDNDDDDRDDDVDDGKEEIGSK